MQKLLRDNQINKNYIAMVQGNWPRELTELKLPLKNPRKKVLQLLAKTKSRKQRRPVKPVR
ncbi:MAG: hypothetical protein GY952_08945 [Rhodobacteraceae bacterium]|nr:hypothetical protein [Paracoccaceae bacterium]